MGLPLRDDKGEIFLLLGRKVDQRGQLKLGGVEFPEQLLNVSLSIEEIELVLQGNQRRIQPFIVNGLRLIKGAFHPSSSSLRDGRIRSALMARQ